MDAFIGQRFEDFETIAGVNVIKLYGDYLLPTTIYLWLISLTASKELSILLLKLLECR